jgi:hypothetical protein
MQNHGTSTTPPNTSEPEFVKTETWHKLRNLISHMCAKSSQSTDLGCTRPGCTSTWQAVEILATQLLSPRAGGAGLNKARQSSLRLAPGLWIPAPSTQEVAPKKAFYEDYDVTMKTALHTTLVRPKACIDLPLMTSGMIGRADMTAAKPILSWRLEGDCGAKL